MYYLSNAELHEGVGHIAHNGHFLCPIYNGGGVTRGRPPTGSRLSSVDATALFCGYNKGVLAQLSGSDYIDYDKKQRSIMVHDCKRVGNAQAATNDLKDLRKCSLDVKPASVAPESVLG